MNILNVICSDRKINVIAIIAVFIYLLLEIPFLTTIRPVMYDEVWYSSVGYNFSIGKGFLNSVVGSGGNANFLLPFCVGLSFKLFGASLFSARIVSVICGLITLITIFKIQKEAHVSYKGIALTLGLFVSLTLFNTVFRFARPECLSLMFSAIGTLYYIRCKQNKNIIDIIILSICCLLSILSHPFAILLFAFYGIDMLIDCIKRRDIAYIFSLIMLLASAIIALFLVSFVSHKYNSTASISIHSLAGRSVFSDNISMIPVAMTAYFKDLFMSRHSATYYLFVIAVLFTIKYAKNTFRNLGIIALFFCIIFPFVFPTDLMMVGLGLDYFTLIGVIVFGTVYDLFSAHYRVNILNLFVILFIVLNAFVTIFFNYNKHDTCNDILTKEVAKIIPENSKVFGSLRLWFFAPNTQFYSDHYRGQMPDANSFDYILINSVDKGIYECYSQIETVLTKYKKIYELNTKQYRTVEIYERH